MRAGVLERKWKQVAKVLDDSLDDVEEEKDHQDEEEAETNQQIEEQLANTNLEDVDATDFSQRTIWYSNHSGRKVYEPDWNLNLTN